MNQNINISQDTQNLPLSAEDLIEVFFSSEINTISESFYASLIELVNVNTLDANNLNGSVVETTNRSLIRIAHMLLIKIESFVDLAREVFQKNKCLQEINDLIFHLVVALHDLDVTTISEKYKGPLAFGISVVAQDLDSLIQDIPEILEVISKESVNV